MDGDPQMYTEENIDKRKKLKDNPEIKQSIEKLMMLFQFDHNKKLSKKNYLEIFVKICYYLRDDLEDKESQEELKELLNEDWKRDSKGKPKMEREDLYNSLFELADIWTPTIDKDDYVSFFEILKQRFMLDRTQAPDIYDILK